MLHLKIEKVLWNIICTFWKELYLKDGKPITKAMDRSYTRLKTLSKCIYIGADTNKMSLLPSIAKMIILIIFDHVTSRWFHWYWARTYQIVTMPNTYFLHVKDLPKVPKWNSILKAQSLPMSHRA